MKKVTEFLKIPVVVLIFFLVNQNTGNANN